MIINGKEQLLEAFSKEDVIFQFNANNLEWTKYILEAIEELKKPVIIAFSEGAIKYIGGYAVAVSLVTALMKDLNITIDVILHLDHGSSYESCKKAIEAGFSSVMFDGSKLAIEENIAETKKVKELADIHNVSVEGELGYVGTGKDTVSYTNVEDAIHFVNETKVDSLAPAVGNAHGIYKDTPSINFDLIKELKEKLNIPLVLHGGSGLSDATFRNCVRNGICKININTELQVAWATGVRNCLEEDKEVYDPRKIIAAGEENIKTKIKDYINMF